MVLRETHRRQENKHVNIVICLLWGTIDDWTISSCCVQVSYSLQAHVLPTALRAVGLTSSATRLLESLRNTEKHRCTIICMT